MGCASGGDPRYPCIHPISLRLGHAVNWNIHNRVIDNIEPIDSGYGNSGNAAGKNDVICNGYVFPKAVEDIDTPQRDRKRKTCNSLALNIVAVDNDVFVGDAELVIPIPTLYSVIMNAL